MNKKTKTRVSKKIVIMIIIVTLFNFVMPKPSQANILADVFTGILIDIPDALWNHLQWLILGEETNDENNTGKKNILLSPGTIFAGKIQVFNINFITADANSENQSYSLDTLLQTLSKKILPKHNEGEELLREGYDDYQNDEKAVQYIHAVFWTQYYDEIPMDGMGDETEYDSNEEYAYEHGLFSYYSDSEGNIEAAVWVQNGKVCLIDFAATDNPNKIMTISVENFKNCRATETMDEQNKNAINSFTESEREELIERISIDSEPRELNQYEMDILSHAVRDDYQINSQDSIDESGEITFQESYDTVLILNDYAKGEDKTNNRTYMVWEYDDEIAGREMQNDNDKVCMIVTENNVTKQYYFLFSALGKSKDKNPMPDIAQKLRPMVSTWYKALQEFAIVGLLSALVYIAIRMVATSASSQKAKYKKMLVGWFEAVCILFSLHFIISLSFTVLQAIVDALAGKIVSPEGTDLLITNIRNSIDGSQAAGPQLYNALIYAVVFFYTVSFTIQYLKRVVYLAFLTLISPLIALTYPLDKVKDGKAQAFEVWMKEFMFNLLIQPVHLLIYNLLVINAQTLANENSFYAVVAIGGMVPAEKFIRKMFGLESKTTAGNMAAALGGAAIMNSINKAGSRGPLGGRFQNGGGPAAGGKGTGKIRTKTPGVDPYSALKNEENINSSNPATEIDNSLNMQNNIKPNTNPSSTKLTQGGTSGGNVKKASGGVKPQRTSSEQPGIGRKNISGKPAKTKGRFLRGAGSLLKTYGPRALKGLAKGTAKVAGAATLGTIGLAAGISTGDFEKAAAGLIGGLAAGNKLGGNLVEGGINLAKGAKRGVGNIADTYRRGAYGEEEAARMAYDKEFKKSKEYKNLIKNNPGSEETIQEFLNAGITDIKKMEKALQENYSTQESIAFIKMADSKGCPNSVLYDPKKFREYIRITLDKDTISPDQLEKIREGIVKFK